MTPTLGTAALAAHLRDVYTHQDRISYNRSSTVILESYYTRCSGHAALIFALLPRSLVPQKQSMQG